MNELPSEPDHVEFIIDNTEPDTSDLIETGWYIEEYKKRPEYRFEVEEAERILAKLGIRATDCVKILNKNKNISN